MDKTSRDIMLQLFEKYYYQDGGLEAISTLQNVGQATIAIIR